MSAEITEDSLVSSEETTEKFRKILKSNGIDDEVSDVIVKDAGLKGVGFMSQAFYVTVEFENPSVKNLNLFAKTETTSETHSKILEDGKLFEKEAIFLSKYVPAATEFAKSKGVENLMEIYPKCYFGDSKLIVLENLVVDKGYELLAKEDLQDFETASLSLTTLAKHHAISHAYIREVGGAEKFFEMFPLLNFEAFNLAIFRGMMESALENGIDTNIRMLEKSKNERKDEVLPILKAMRYGETKVWDALEVILKVKENEEKHLVLNHGDYQNSNMFFLRDDEATKKWKKHVAIDFQISRYNSPALDICCFFNVSVQPEVRRNRLKDLLTIYLEVFNSTTAKLGYPVDLSYDELFRLYCQKLPFGIWLLGMLTVSAAGLLVLKQIDITKIDMRDFAKIYVALIQKWMDDNPEALENDAEQIVRLVLEYKEFCLNK